MKKKSNYQFLKAVIIHAVLALAIIILQACGGGSDSGNTPEPDDTPNKTPVISTVVADKSTLNFTSNENSSEEITISIEYDDKSTISRTLKVSWSSLKQEFTVEDNEKIQYIVELLNDAKDQSKKILKITEPESKKIIEVSVDIESLPIKLISQLELIPNKSTLNVNDSETLDVQVLFNNSEVMNTLPDGVSCKLQQGEGVITITGNCNIQAIAPGIAKVTLDVANGLLADNVELPVINISVVAPAGSTDPVTPVVTKLSINLEAIEVSADSSSSFTADLQRTYSDDSYIMESLKIQWMHESSSFVVTNANGDEFSENFVKAKNILTIIDPVSGRSIDIAVTIKQPEQAPHITKLILTSNKQQLLVGEVAEIKVSAEDSNGITENDVNSKVVCVASASSVSPNIVACRVTVQSAGTVEIGAQLLSPQTNAPVVEAIALTFSDPTPKVTEIKLNASSITIKAAASSVQTLQLTRIYDIAAEENLQLNIEWRHDTKKLSVFDSTNKIIQSSFDDSNFANGSGILTITDPVSQMSKSVDVSIELNTNTTTIDLLKFDVANTQLDSGQLYPLMVVAKYSDNQTLPANDLVQCSVDLTLDPIADEKIIVTQDCGLKTMFPGTYQINAQLLDQNNASPGMQVEPLTVVVNPLMLGSFATGNEFAIDVSVNTPGIAFRLADAVVEEIYKLTLSSNALLGIQENFEFHTLSEPLSGKGCFNNTVLGESTVACGLKTSNTDIFIYIQDPNQNNLGLLDYKLTVNTDNDILQSDGKVGGDYQNMSIGIPVSGHVSANAYNVNNTSYYKVDKIKDPASGMNMAGGDYVVTVTFQSPYYSEDSIVVKYDSLALAGTPINECVYEDFTFTPETQTISCIVSNFEKPQTIYVEILGNSPYGNLTAADGELSYSVEITQP